MNVFWDRKAKIAGMTVGGRRVDVRFDGWIPFSIRHGHRPHCRAVRVPVVGWVIVTGRSAT